MNVAAILAALLLLPDGDAAGGAPATGAVDPGSPGGAPSDAIVLFDGKDLSRWRGRNGEPRWEVKDGVLTIAPGTGDLTTRDAFGDIQLHMEWRIPAGVSGEGEGRGNSGIKLHEAYEIQILDSHGKPPSPTGAGALYKQAAPLVNACRKPGEWQSFDIIFRAPRFDTAAGGLKEHGAVTVLQNGILIHDRARIQGRTNSTRPVKPDLEQPFFLQDHGSPVSFRNIWVRKLIDRDKKDKE